MTLKALYLLAALVILWRTLHVISVLDIRQFNGRPWQFIALASHCALVGAGAVAVALGATIGGPMLLLGVAALVLGDRRRIR